MSQEEVHLTLVVLRQGQTVRLEHAVLEPPAAGLLLRNWVPARLGRRSLGPPAGPARARRVAGGSTGVPAEAWAYLALGLLCLAAGGLLLYLPG